MKKSLLVMAMFSSSIYAACPTTQDSLIISEYMEGSSNNKAIEIFNGTGASFDLSTVQLLRYSNGSATVSGTYSYAGTLADGAVYVVANNNALVSNGGALPDAQSDDTSGVVNWNGDDAIELTVGGTVVDSIGQVGFDPGSEWNSGGVGTANETLRRVAGQCGGDTDSSDVFDPSAEWVSHASNTVDGFGSNESNLLPVELTNFSVE